MKVKWLSAVVGGQPHFNQDRTQSPAAYSGSHHPLARRELTVSKGFPSKSPIALRLDRLACARPLALNRVLSNSS
jgi:hypothetical protein